MTRPCILPPQAKAAIAAQAYRSVLPVLETERLRLRAPVMEDLPAWTDIYVEGFGERGDEEKAWEEFSYYTAEWILRGHGLFAVTEKTSDTLLGFTLIGLEWEDMEPELGWMLLKEHRGKGYATEASVAVRDFAASLLGPGSFVSYINHENIASQAVARRIGAARDMSAEAAIDHSDQVWRHGATA